MSRKPSRMTLPPAAPPTSRSCRALRIALARWYARCRRDLPWRRTSDPYRIWVSEVMLQQTQVQTVEPYYNRFIEQFPDVSSLAAADLQTVLKLWEGLGYYSRARNLHRAAGIVVAELAGRVPATWETLRRLPGVGDYIAAAVLSIAFGQAHAVVDGNVKRVLARIYMLDTPVNQSATHKVFRVLAEQLLDQGSPGAHNQAMMELGALVCTPRRPDCASCPIARFCRALRQATVFLYPKKDRRRPLPTRRMVAAAVFKKGKILLVRRPAQGLLGGLWEFPGGPLDDGVDPVQACLDRFKSAVGLEIVLERRVDTIGHVYTHFKLQMELYLGRWQSGRVRLSEYDESRWICADHIGDLPLHGAMHKALVRLRRMLEQPGFLG
jgi:A/G-specific adenine glycosylase